jgi:hypothetical protein
MVKDCNKIENISVVIADIYETYSKEEIIWKEAVMA